MTWAGSLVDGMRDESGQMYMRNRYYDPATGQFTQPDPIGIAGGLNSYGFAAGDPVSYSDPYGLCAVRRKMRTLNLPVWMMPIPDRHASLLDYRELALEGIRSMQSLSMILTHRLQENSAGRLEEDISTTSEIQDRLGDCLRACERGGEAIERFCKSIPIKERRVRALCWAVTKGSEPLCKGFCYAREWEGWPW